MGPQNEATVDITLCQMFILPLVGGPIYLLLLARIAMQSIRCGPLLHKQVLRGLCLCVCLLATTMSPTKMVQSQMTFEVRTQGTREGAL